MEYSIGDVVQFKVGNDEQRGEVQFIEKSQKEHILYINGYNRWAYKVPEKGIVARILAKNKNK